MRVVPHQLLVREDELGHEEVEAVANPSSEPPEVIESRSGGRVAPVLGTMDLLELSRAMVAKGYRPVHLELRDSGFRELPPTLDQDLQSAALGELRSGAPAERILHSNEQVFTVAVIETELADARGLRVRLLRNGAVFPDAALDLEAFVRALTEAWHEVRGG